MKLTIDPTDCAGVYSVAVLDPPLAVTQLTELLESDPNWEQPPTVPETAQWAVHSLTWWQTHNAVLQDVCWKFDNAEVKRQILHSAQHDKVFQEFWSFPEMSCMDAITGTYAHFIKTPARYRDHPWHVDCKNLVLQGMIYLVDQTDESQGTWFSTDRAVLGNNGYHDRSILKIPATPWRGWLLVNSDHSYHRALNLTEQPRFSLKFGLQFNLKPSHSRPALAGQNNI